MTKFIGLLLWMGVVKYPNISDYWSKAERYENSSKNNEQKQI